MDFLGFEASPVSGGIPDARLEVLFDRIAPNLHTPKAIGNGFMRTTGKAMRNSPYYTEWVIVWFSNGYRRREIIRYRRYQHLIERFCRRGFDIRF
jgi:hypothetical protein